MDNRQKKSGLVVHQPLNKEVEHLPDDIFQLNH